MRLTIKNKIKLPSELFMEVQEKLDVLSDKSNIDLIILCVTVIMLFCSDPLCTEYFIP